MSGSLKPISSKIRFSQIEAMLQLLQFAMIEKGLAEGMKSPRFEPLQLHSPMTWKYRGQVVPKNHVITTTLEVLEECHEGDGSVICTGRASLWVDGRRIYEAEPIGMRIVEGPSPVEPAPDPIADEGNQPSSNSHENNESSTNSEVAIPFKPGSIEEPEVLPKELVTHPDGVVF